MYLMKNKK